MAAWWHSCQAGRGTPVTAKFSSGCGLTRLLPVSPSRLEVTAPFRSVHAFDWLVISAGTDFVSGSPATLDYKKYSCSGGKAENAFARPLYYLQAPSKLARAAAMPAPEIPEEEWDAHKDVIVKYFHKLTAKQLLEYLKDSHGFCPTLVSVPLAPVILRC